MKSLKRFICILISAVLICQVVGCGRWLFPERTGQKGGVIDAKVAVVDGLGLFVFIIPGVVAYIVDFTTGCIYLPPGHKNVISLTDEPVKVVHLSPELLNSKVIEAVVVNETGISKNDMEKVQVIDVCKDINVRTKLVELEKLGYTLN